MLVRILLVIPVYLLAATYIPQIPFLRPFFESLYNVAPAQVIQISVAAFVIGAGLTAFFIRHPTGKRLVKGESIGRLIQVAAIGALFAALSILIDVYAGQTPQLFYLILFPAAFVIAELAHFVFAFVQKRLGKTPEDSVVDVQPGGEWREFSHGHDDRLVADTGPQDLPEPVDSPLTRVFVYIAVYALVVGLLPLQEDYRRLMEPLDRVHPNLTALLSVLAVVLSGFAAFMIFRNASPFQRGAHEEPNWLLIALLGACGGLAFGGLINLVAFFTGAPGDIETLLTVTVALSLAELIVAMVQFRMHRRFDD